jgi:hypothetical protein
MDENLSVDEIFAEREEWAKKSLREISHADAISLIDRLFAENVTHPWYEPCKAILEDNAGARIVCGVIPGNYEFLFVPALEKGIWFRFAKNLEAVGTIGKRGVKILSALSA